MFSLIVGPDLKLFSKITEIRQETERSAVVKTKIGCPQKSLIFYDFGSQVNFLEVCIRADQMWLEGQYDMKRIEDRGHPFRVPLLIENGIDK